jgi:hypothetical protein
VTLILHAPIIFISVERSFDSVVVELGIVGLILWVEAGLSSSISPWNVAKKVKATPWSPLASVTTLSPFMLFLQVTALNSYAGRDLVIRAYVRPWTDILYRLQMFPKAIELALAEAAPRQG